MTKTPTWPRAAALFAALAIAATACSNGGGKKPSTQAKSAVATAATAITAVDPQAAERVAVFAAIQEYHRFYEQAIANPDPSDAALAAHLTGTALARMQRDLAGFASTHEGVRLTSVANDPPVVGSLESGRAVIDECTRSIAHYFDVRTGDAQGAPPATAPTEAGLEYVFVLEAGKWKLAEKNNKSSACQHS